MAAPTAGVKGSILITGANGGLGSALVEQIASSPELSAYYGIYTVRDAASAPALTSAIERAKEAVPSGHQHEVLSLDLTKLDNVRQVAGDINNRVASGLTPPIRALILNAGFQDFGRQSWTDDGLDVTFAANYLGHWLLTLLLLKSLDKEAGRIIVIGSRAHDPTDKRNDRTSAFTPPQYRTILPSPPTPASFTAIANGTWSPSSADPSFRSGYRRYGAAKLFLTMTLLHELQSRLSRQPALSNISVLGVDPGGMISGMQRLAPWFIRVLLFKVVYPAVLWLKPEGGLGVRPVGRAVGEVVEAAFGEGIGSGGEGEGLTGKGVYLEGGEVRETSEEARDAEKRKVVWEETVKLAGLVGGETVLEDWQ